MKRFLGLLLLGCIALGANAQLLWKVSGNGLAEPSYLFGTYHLSPVSIKDSIAALPQALDETAQVYGEVIMADMMKPEFMVSMQQQMMLPKDTTLQSLFTPEQYNQVNQVAKEYMGVDLAMLAQLKPAAINQQLAVMICVKHTPGFNPQEQLDSYFQQQALQQGKKVGGLESAQSQIDVLLNKQSLRRQAELLYCAASDIEKGVRQTKELIDAYARQDLEKMLQLMEEREGTSCDPNPEEWADLLDNRNRAWIKQIPTIMKEAPTFFVIGAGHLPGKTGLLGLLKELGYTVEPMK